MCDLPLYLEPHAGWLRAVRRGESHGRSGGCGRVAGTTLESHEARLVRDFKLAYHLQRGDLPDPEDWMSWSARMQHYGYPARFIDFSESVEIAAFFALHDSCVATEDTEPAAIWAVNTFILRRMLQRQLMLPDGSQLDYKDDWIGVVCSSSYREGPRSRGQAQQ